jgi:myo-inositol-1(or 4)-monophosphatase
MRATMDLEVLWERIFSEDADQVRLAWQSLDGTERDSVYALLQQIIVDETRIDAQRAAAKFALAHVAPDVSGVVNIPEDALAFAQQLAHQTGQHLLQTHGQLTASLKRDGTLVTESDLESDRQISRAILERYPTHGIMSEERDKIYRGQEWCWLIDPIDGTTNFTWGFPAWGVLIALMHWGVPVLGVADFPVIGEQYSAVRGLGTWLNGMQLRTTAVSESAEGIELKQTHLFACCTRSLKYGKFDLPMKIRIPGTTGYDLALVARGACVGSIDMSVHVWDVAALWPILEEAGGAAMINREQSLFPLQQGVDYGEASYSVITACSPRVLAHLHTKLSDRFVVSP